MTGTGFGIAPGQQKLHKLQHVKFSPCLYMQVKLAAHVIQDFFIYIHIIKIIFNLHEI